MFEYDSTLRHLVITDKKSPRVDLALFLLSCYTAYLVNVNILCINIHKRNCVCLQAVIILENSWTVFANFYFKLFGICAVQLLL